MLACEFPGNCSVIECVTLNGTSVSSSCIREYLLLGDIESANRMLGYNYYAKGKVIHGKKLGRSIGAPTANILFPENKLIPRHGVYAVKVRISGTDNEYIGVSNVGNRPTVKDKFGVTCETFILDFNEDIYGKEITVSFYTKIRDEKKFSSIDELSEEIIKNALWTREYFLNN